MRKRAVRVAVVVLLVVGTAAAAQFLRNIDRRSAEVLLARNDVDQRLAALSDVLSGIGAAQQSYIAPGQGDEPWFQRMSGLVRRMYDDIAALRPLLQSAAADQALRALSEGTDALIGADARARENLRLGQPLMAADVIFSDSRNTLDVMSFRVRELRAAEHSAHSGAFAALARERWIVLGGALLGWLAGVVLLVPIPVADVAAVPALSTSPPASAAPSESPAIGPPVIDLSEAASLCTALSRLSSTAELPGLLARTASLLEASGIILWMSAGEELFAVTAHGYQPQMIARLGPIPGNADNATAAAWRTGEVTTVAAEGDGQGAIVAPMFGPDGCIGVLAFEVRHGVDRSMSARAVAAMIAAQLATAVSAWPAASAAQAPVELARKLAREFRSSRN